MGSVPRWDVDAVAALFDLPFNDLIHRAHSVHRENFDPNAVQLSTLLSIKTGGCAEDCGYCPQSARYHTNVENEDMLDVDAVVAAARAARDKRRHPLLHGRRVARPEATRSRARCSDMVKAVRELGWRPAPRWAC